MKLSGPLLILLLVLSLPAQAQVQRESTDLHSRARANSRNLPSGWLGKGPAASDAEPAQQWNYRHEQAVRRVASSIQADARELLQRRLPAAGGQQSIATRSRVSKSSGLASDPGRSAADKSAEAGSAAVSAGEQPALARDTAAPPLDELSFPEEETAPAADAAESAGSGNPAAEDQALAEQATDDPPAAEQAKQADPDFQPDYSFRVKLRADTTDDEVPESAVDADHWPSGQAEPETIPAPEGTEHVIDEALQELAAAAPEQRADSGFLPDEEIAAPAAAVESPGHSPNRASEEPAAELPQRPAPDSRDAVPEPLVPRALPAAGTQKAAAPLGSAPLQPRLVQDTPLLPDYEVRDDLGKISRGNPRLKQVALTFDDGPHPQYTAQILSILDYYDAPATFFFVGVQANKYPEWLLMAKQQGHEIGSQTYDHFRLPKLPEAEKEYQIDAYQDLVEQLTGERPRFLRPPGGQIDDDCVALLKKRGIVCAMWDVALNDTHGNKTQAELLQHTLDSVRNGSIILAHDGVQATIDMLPELIEQLRGEGYELVTMSELASKL